MPICLLLTLACNTNHPIPKSTTKTLTDHSPDTLCLKDSISNLEDLVTSIKKNNISSPFHLLKRIPFDLSELPILLKSTDSLQFASKNNPRVISTNNSAELMVAFGHSDAKQAIVDNPSLESDKNLEVIEFEKSTGDWIFKEGKLASIDGSGKKCASCHGTKLTPIWQEYPYWPNSILPVKNFNNLFNARSYEDSDSLLSEEIERIGPLYSQVESTFSKLNEEIESFGQDFQNSKGNYNFFSFGEEPHGFSSKNSFTQNFKSKLHVAQSRFPRILSLQRSVSLYRKFRQEFDYLEESTYTRFANEIQKYLLNRERQFLKDPYTMQSESEEFIKNIEKTKGLHPKNDLIFSVFLQSYKSTQESENLH